MPRICFVSSSRLHRFWLIALLLLPLAVSSAADEAEPSSPLLWQATRGEDVVHCFGTIHVGRQDMYPFPEAVMEAIRASDVIAFEVDFGNPFAIAMAEAKWSVYPKGDDLTQHLQPETLALLGRHLEAVGLSLETMKGMKPWMVAVGVTMAKAGELGCSPELGVEMQLVQIGQRLGKRFAGLEEPNRRYALLDELDQDAFLTMTLTQLEEGAKELEAMLAAWRSGDAETLTRVAIEDPMASDPAVKELYSRILDERNGHMVEALETLLERQDAVFVAIGTAHLLGKGSVLDLLEKAGFSVEQVPTSPAPAAP